MDRINISTCFLQVSKLLIDTSMLMCFGGGNSLVERRPEGGVPDGASLTNAIAQVQGALGLVHHKEQGAVHPTGKIAGKQLLCSLKGISCP